MNTDSKPLHHLNLAPLYAGIAIAIAVYWPGLMGPFFFDDHINITLLDGIRLKTLSLESVRQAMDSGHAGPLGRPVSQLSFALNYYFSGFDPFAYKLTNLVIHGLNGFLVYAIAVRLLAATYLAESNENTRLVAALVAMAWLLHPIQLTSVLYVVQRMTSLSSLFLFAAILLHINARRRPFDRSGIAYLLSAWLVLWPLSLFSKESGLLFIGFIFIYEAIILRHINHGFDLFGKILLGTMLCLGLGILIYLLTPAGREWILGGYGFRPFTLTERLLTETRVIWTYLGLILLPRLNAFALYHDDIAISTGLLAPWSTLPALLGVFGLFLIAWKIRLHNPLMSFAIAWFLIAHSLESTIFSLELAHEHRNYVGLLGILLLPIVLLRELEQYKTLRIASTAVILAILSFSVFTTALRSHQFGDGLRRALMEAEHHPLSSRSNLTAGSELVKGIAPKDRNTHWYNLVRKYNELPVKLDPASKAGLLGLIHLNCISGITIDPSWIAELERRLAKTRLAPADSNLLHSIKEISLQNRRCLDDRDVRKLFNAALSNTTTTSESRMFLYVWYSDYLIFHENDLDAAKAALMKAKNIAPTEPHLKEKWEILMRIENERNKPKPTGKI